MRIYIESAVIIVESNHIIGLPSNLSVSLSGLNNAELHIPAIPDRIISTFCFATYIFPLDDEVSSVSAITVIVS